MLLVLFVVHHEGADECRAQMREFNHERHERHEKEPVSDVRVFGGS
jgi:hypothetical protein